MRQFQDLVEEISVSVALQNRCLVSQTPVKRLRESNMLSKPEISSSTSSPSLWSRVCVIPQVEPMLDEEQEEEISEDRTLNDLEISDLEATPLDDSSTMSLKDTEVGAIGSDGLAFTGKHLFVRFHCTNFSTLKVSPHKTSDLNSFLKCFLKTFSSFSFEVSLCPIISMAPSHNSVHQASAAKLSNQTANPVVSMVIKPKTISNTELECAVPIQRDVTKYSKNPERLVVMCCNPR